jgi:hypothetical protein
MVPELYAPATSRCPPAGCGGYGDDDECFLFCGKNCVCAQRHIYIRSDPGKQRDQLSGISSPSRDAGNCGGQKI